MTIRILRWATGCVAAVSVALIAGGIALSYADRHLVLGSGWDFSSVFEEVTFMAIPAVGFVLASRRPGNRIGWIFLGMGLVDGLAFFCQRYGQRGLVAAAGSLPAARAAAWFLNWAWVIPVAGFGFILLLFPTGRLRSRRWRPAAWFVAAVCALYAAAMVTRACRVWADRRFIRARYDADQTMAAFAAHLKDAVDLDTVCEDLARAVQAALEPAHVSVWTSRRE